MKTLSDKDFKLFSYRIIRAALFFVRLLSDRLIGDESDNIIKTLSFDDEQATDKLNELKEEYPANLIVVSGELTIDLPDKIADYATSHKRFKLSSNKLTFNNCLLDDAIAVLEDQYAIGSVEVTVINPVPKI